MAKGGLEQGIYGLKVQSGIGFSLDDLYPCTMATLLSGLYDVVFIGIVYLPDE